MLNLISQINYLRSLRLTKACSYETMRSYDCPSTLNLTLIKRDPLLCM